MTGCGAKKDILDGKITVDEWLEELDKTQSRWLCQNCRDHDCPVKKGIEEEK